jgi:hypothetical protein
MGGGGVGDRIENVNNIFFKYVLVPQKSTRNWIKINKISEEIRKNM